MIVSPNLEAVIEACIDKVRHYSPVTFAELYPILEHHGIPTDGQHALELDSCPNMALWVGMSREFFEIACAVYRDERIELGPTDMFVYLIDGRVPMGIPVAKRPPKSGYRKPHWLPVVFRWTGPRPSRDEIRRGLLAEATEEPPMTH